MIAELDNFTDNEQVFTFGSTIPNRWVGVGNNPSISYSSDGLTWFSANDILFYKRAYGVEWNGLLWVAVGDNSNSNEHSICYSYDGIIWTPSLPQFAFKIGRCVAWNGNMWIAGGEREGTYNSNMWNSYDGMNWNTTNTNDIGIVYGITWNGNIWVAVGETSTTSIVYSYDGIIWIQATNAFNVGFGIAWNGSLWVAVGNGGLSQICYSTDGINWNPSANPFSSVGYAVKWNGILWVAVGDSIGVGIGIVYSYDGIIWNQCTLPFNLGTEIYSSLCWNGTIWVAFQQDAPSKLIYSSNGVNWLPKTSSILYGYGLAYNDKRYNNITFPKNRVVALGQNNMIYSDDGINWIPANNQPFKMGKFIAWNGKMWVAVGSRDPYTSIAYSYNGKDWINATNIFEIGNGVKWNGTMWVATGRKNETFNTSIAYSYDGICWKAAYQDIFATVGYAVDWDGTKWVAAGQEPPLLYSYNGDVWNIPNTSVDFKCFTVVWNGTMWIAGGDSGILLYSYDGFNWFQVVLPAPMTNIYTAAWNGSMWLVGGDQNTYIYYSYNGQLWDNINITTPPANIIYGITWDGNKWIAVGNSTDIYYSYDTFTWLTTPSNSNSPIYGVGWNANIGSIYIQQPTICLGYSDINNTISYSIDGIKYVGLGHERNTLFQTGYASAWNGNMWVAVGQDTTTIAYSYDGIKWKLVIGSDSYISIGYAVVWTGLNWVVGGRPNINNLYYSPDGINWLPSSPSLSFQWRGLATDVKTILGGRQSTTVAVGVSGIIYYSQDDGINWIQANNSLPFDLSCVHWNGTTWLAGGSSSDLYFSFEGINWNGPINTGATTNEIHSIFWNGVVWVFVGDYNLSSSSYQIYYTTALDGQTGWTPATINVLGSPPIYFRTVIWNGVKWIAGGHNPFSPISYILTSHDGITWYESPPLTTPSNPYINPVNQVVNGLSSNSTIGGVVVDSQISLNKNNSTNLTTKIDVVSERYFNNGFNNMTLSINNSQLL